MQSGEQTATQIIEVCLFSQTSTINHLLQIQSNFDPEMKSVPVKTWELKYTRQVPKKRSWKERTAEIEWHSNYASNFSTISSNSTPEQWDPLVSRPATNFLTKKDDVHTFTHLVYYILSILTPNQSNVLMIPLRV